MPSFEHYMYVLECGDSSLYTGYTTDVAARLAAHQSGSGAKYTKSHAPVRLVAQARFYSKERAMSAEALFKRLDRGQKDALLAKAADTPLEDVLRAELPGFDEDTAGEFVCRSLAENVDVGYRDFHSRLVPTVDARTIAGVRTPDLRRIAKELVRREDVNAFLRALPHRLFDENQVHAFCIGRERDYGPALELNGMEVTQFTYFQQVGGIDCDPVPAEITYGLERLAMYIQGVDSVYDLVWSKGPDGTTFTYGDVFYENEREQSAYDFEFADTDMLFARFDANERECMRLLDLGLPLPAYDCVMKCSHAFNLLDARGAISATERMAYILRVRTMAKPCCESYLEHVIEKGGAYIASQDGPRETPADAEKEGVA